MLCLWQVKLRGDGSYFFCTSLHHLRANLSAACCLVIFNTAHFQLMPTVCLPQKINPRLFPCSPSLHFHINTPPNPRYCLSPLSHPIALTQKHNTLFHFFFFTSLRCVKKWRPYPVERQRLSFLHMLRDVLLEKLSRSRSFGDLASLRPRPKSSLEVYVSVLCPPPTLQTLPT